jgi:transposase
MMIGVDLAKSVFQVHGALRTGAVQFRKKLTRQQFTAFMARQAPCPVIFEACGGAHYWVRKMEALGQEVKLIAPQHVRPFLKHQKNDAADAEAILIAARQAEMHFVAPKTVEQQSHAAVFRDRERLIHQRTAATGLACAAQDCAGQLAITNVGAPTHNAGRDRAGQQDGPADLGNADEKRRLQGSGAGSRGMMPMSN